VASGVPFAREYSGYLANRSFGGAQVSRTFYARGQTGQQLLLGAYQAMARQIHLGTVQLYNRMDVQDVVVHDGRAQGIIARDLLTGEMSAHSAHAVLLCTGGYGNVTSCRPMPRRATSQAPGVRTRRAQRSRTPCYTQIHPTCIPPADEFQSKLTLMSESLRNDGRIWAPTDFDEQRSPGDIPEGDRDYFLERKYPAFGNLVPRDVASRNAKTVVDEGRGVGPLRNGVYLDFSAAIDRFGAETIKARYGNLFDMYERITGEDPYTVPMRIYPATHYTMGGLWVDYNLQTTIPGLFALGEANFSDHGANRLGASALMQGLADGYFVAPETVPGYLAGLLGTSPLETTHEAFTTSLAECQSRADQLLAVKGTHSVDHYHRELGKLVWDYCGMARNKAGLEKALSEIPALRDEFWTNVKVLGDGNSFNQSLEKALRVADFMEFAELKVRDALHREESCGGHFREEHQTEEGEAKRDDENFAYVGAWEYGGPDIQNDAVLHKEQLVFENVQLTQRSYK
jgi:succinate dehydrogenase / fumarate reductase flavoprotein subunit